MHTDDIKSKVKSKDSTHPTFLRNVGCVYGEYPVFA